jgi:hypothetical protein
MNIELGKDLEERGDLIELLSGHLPEGDKKYHKKSVRIQTCRQRFEPSTFRLQACNNTATVTCTIRKMSIIFMDLLPIISYN